MVATHRSALIVQPQAPASIPGLPHARNLAARLDDLFRLLTDGRRTALPRHQTLRAMLDWSDELLPKAERAVAHLQS
jgi:hypothetical protein